VSIVLQDVQSRLRDEELSVHLTSQAVDFLVRHGYDEAFGARPLKRAVQKWIEDPLSEKILLGEFAKGDDVEIDLGEGGDLLVFRVPASSPKA
jgi:ATP-dependent Clp protease ATP-binding subunit ClpC